MSPNFDIQLAAAPALSSIRQSQRSIDALSRQMSTGLRIQSAADDAAGLALSSQLTAQTRGLAVAARNTLDAISSLQTAEGGLADIANLLTRMREIAVQAANATYTPANRAALNDEFLALRDQIDAVVSTRRWNGFPLLDGSYAKLIQVGEEASKTFPVSVGDFRTASVLPAFTAPMVLRGSGTLQATPLGTQNYTTQIEIDTTTFASGGRITATIQLGGGASAASYDLFRNAVTVTTGSPSYPVNSLANAYDVPPGRTTQLNYNFAASATDKYVLGIEGNWGSPAGATNSFTYEVSVSGPSSGSILTTDAAGASLAPIDLALQAVSSGRAQIGAQINALSSRSNTIAGEQINLLASRSRVHDLDYAGATTEMARQLALQTAAQSVIRRNLDTPRWVVDLLEAVPQ